MGVAGWKGMGVQRPVTNGRPMYTRGGHGGEVSLYVLPPGGGSGGGYVGTPADPDSSARAIASVKAAQDTALKSEKVFLFFFFYD